MRTENILGLNDKQNNISKSTSFITHKYINNTTIFNKPSECICHNYISASIWDASHRDASHWNASHWYAENGPRLNGTRLIGTSYGGYTSSIDECIWHAGHLNECMNKSL